METTVVGSVYSIAEIGEVLAWIGVALGSSKVDGIVARLYPSCTLSNGQPSRETLTVLISNTRGSSIGAEPIPDSTSKVSTLPGRCWKGIFGNPVLVAGYRIPRRDDPNTGMEVSLDLMAQLVGARKISIFGGKILIKGYSAILVPTRKRGGYVFWHMISNDGSESSGNSDDSDCGYISYSDNSVKTLLQQYPENLIIHDLETSRHILGWCSNVDNLAGKKNPKNLKPRNH